MRLIVSFGEGSSAAFRNQTVSDNVDDRDALVIPLQKQKAQGWGTRLLC